jgi:hypothetical protein
MLPDSLALIPPPPLAGSTALADDQEVARSTFRLRDTPRFALAASDYDLKLTHLTSDFFLRAQHPDHQRGFSLSVHVAVSRLQ